MGGRRLTWLHLSDLHVEVRDGHSQPARDQERCWKALAGDIADLRVKDGKGEPDCTPDFIVLSGDIVKRGEDADSFELATQCVERWCEAADVPPERVLVIPGNHDIDREQVPDEHVLTTKGQPGLLDLSTFDTHSYRQAEDKIFDSSATVELIESKLANYRAFAERYATVEWGPMHSWRLALEIDGLATQLIGFNSVWTGGADRLDRPGVPVVGYAQREWVEEISSEEPDPDVTFVLQHNPVSYLYPVDALHQSNWLDKRDAVVLSGHLHRSELAERRSIHGRHLEMMGGALYVGYHWHRGYSFGFLTVEEEKRRFSIGQRSQSGDSVEFRWDERRQESAGGGLVRFSQGLSSPSLGAPIEAGPQLAIDSEKARLTFEGDSYLVEIEKAYVNPTPVCCPCAEAQVLVNAFPDEPERSRALYREHPLDLEEIGFTARCNGKSVPFAVQKDLDSNKTLLIPFGGAGEGSELQPGARAVLAYSFRIEKKLWGPYFERHVNRETQRLECELRFPPGVVAELCLLRNPRLESESLDEEIEGEEDALSTVFRWKRDRPRLQSRYKFIWRFADGTH